VPREAFGKLCSWRNSHLIFVFSSFYVKVRKTLLEDIEEGLQLKIEKGKAADTKERNYERCQYV
jgi:hypothetical protein